MKRVKPGVRLADVSPRAFFAYDVAEECYRAVGVTECWLTSANDGAHSEKSRHYPRNTETGMCEAIDLRLHNVSPEKRAVLVNNIKSSLGGEYDVVWEAAGTPNEHIHLEYDP